MLDDRAGTRVNLLGKASLYIWSALLWIIGKLLLAAGGFNPKLKQFLLGRSVKDPSLAALIHAREKYEFAVVFYCSSAGEYEQAKPIIERLNQRGSFYVLIIFFSQSGANFAKKRGEVNPYILSPIDNIWFWRRFFAQIRPTVTIIVRHELWPAFIFAAREVAPVVIINASTKAITTVKDRCGWLIKNFLMKRVDRIFVVDGRAFAEFKSLGLSNGNRMRLTGDTKYDRVAERQVAQQATIAQFIDLIDGSLSPRRRLIIGSAWPDDVDIVLSARVLWKELPDYEKNWHIIVALHEPTPANLEALKVQCHLKNLSYVYLSELSARDLIDRDVIIVDRIGVLSELYGVCAAAIVGGAMHHKVHNVLEPFCYGIPIAFGPRYKNSHEASALIDEEHATIVKDSVQLLKWWKTISVDGPREVEGRRVYLKRQLGASERILKELAEIIPAFRQWP